MDAFESHVTANKYSADEADIILTTVHSAKGLVSLVCFLPCCHTQDTLQMKKSHSMTLILQEWDHVEICEDLLDLSAESFIDSEEAIWRRPSFLKEIPDQIKSEKPASLEIPKGEKRKGWQFGLSHYRDADINLVRNRQSKTCSSLLTISLSPNLLSNFSYTLPLHEPKRLYVYPKVLRCCCRILTDFTTS